MMFGQTHVNDKVVIDFNVYEDDLCRQERLGLSFKDEYVDWVSASGSEILNDTVVYAKVTYWMDGSAGFDTLHYDGSRNYTKCLAVDMEDIIESLLEEMLVAYFQ